MTTLWISLGTLVLGFTITFGAALRRWHREGRLHWAGRDE